ncbi:MAG TPA: nucleotidyltransferase domain-containing protein [Prolixibacteraceae bacterium]|jgi:predicted nucleotidyltransferase|nr:nucleotidyltransferase domain-containing protein [Prolixibacteraceae bacterium]
MLSELVKKEIIENLRTIDPVKVILFGSYAYGIPNQDSDIDLYVVTKEDFIPESFEENLQIKKKVYMALSDIRKKYASDILVHTLPVHQKFIELGSSFSKEIMQKGIVLI